jgi:hypothetical protein
VGVVAGAGPVEVFGDFDRDLGEAGGVEPSVRWGREGKRERSSCRVSGK